MKILAPPNMPLLYRGLRLARADILAIGMMACFRFGKTGADALVAGNEMWQLVARALGKDAVLDEGYPKPAGEFKVRAAPPAPDDIKAKELRARVGALSKSLIVSRDKPLNAADLWGHDIAAPARQQYLGACDGNWLANDWPHLPADTGPEFFMSAPPDQRLSGWFSGDETFELDHLHPSAPRVQGALPGLRARCFVGLRAPDGDTLREVQARAETVWLFPEHEFGIVLYRAVAHCADSDASDVRHIKAAWETMASAPLPFEHYRGAFIEETAAQTRGAPAFAAPSRPERKADMPAANAASSAAPAAVGAGASAEAALAQIKAELSGVDAMTGELNAQTRALIQQHNLSETEIASHMKGVDVADAPVPPMSDIEKMTSELNAQTREMIDQYKLDEAVIAKHMEAPSLGLPPSPAAIARQVDDLNAQTRALIQEHKLSEADILRKMPPDMQGISPLSSATESAAGAFAPLSALLPPATPKLETSASETSISALNASGKKTAPAPLTRDDVIARHAAKQSLAGCELSGLDLSGLDFSGADFSGATLDKTSFAKSRLEGANFTRAILRETDFSAAVLNNALLAKTSAAGGKFAQANLHGAQLAEGDFTAADFSSAQLVGADLRGAIFDRANMSGLNASACRAERASFTDSDLGGANFGGAALARASFSGSHLANCDFSAAACRQAEFYGADAQAARFDGAELGGSRADAATRFDRANFSGAKLRRACWEGVQIRGAIFADAMLDHADLEGAQAQAAQFGTASAKGANLSRADLSGACLDDVNLFGGTLRKANMRGAYLRFANLYGVDFDDTQPTLAMLEGANIDRTILQFRPPAI